MNGSFQKAPKLMHAEKPRLSSSYPNTEVSVAEMKRGAVSSSYKRGKMET